MKAFYLIVFLNISFISFLSAQRVCTSDLYAQNMAIVSPHHQSLGNRPVRDTIENEIIIIPVVIHLIYNTEQQNISDAQVISQLNALNKDYRMLNDDARDVPEAFRSRTADTKIRFCIAQVDPKGNATTGIIRKKTVKEYFKGDDAMKFSAAGGDDAWDSKQYLNIWVCNMYGKSLGYATMPGGPADKDGVIINWDVFGTIGKLRAPFDKGRTATHEIAHWLGLKHIWGDDVCGNDGVDDTPPQKSYNFYCPAFPKVSNCSIDNNGDMYMNFMDLTDDPCMNMFTHGQKNKMRGLFALNGYRNSFLNAYQCDSSLTSGGTLPEDTTLLKKAIPAAQIFPNPVAGHINIVPQNDFVLENKNCTIYSLQGKVVFEQKLKSQNIQLNVSFLPPGVYFLKLGEGSDKNMFKFIKL